MFTKTTTYGYETYVSWMECKYSAAYLNWESMRKDYKTDTYSLHIAKKAWSAY